jgi:teichuronic acid biosynthesis glycosyltransferase TuaG
MTPDLVSIVMPAYNSESFIAEAIASVQAQTYTHWNLIVVDDCSIDATGRVAREQAARDPRVSVLKSPANSGTAAARNLGLSNCSGRYVAFLDADDVWAPEKLEKQIAFMAQHKAGFSFTAYRKFGPSGPRGVIGARHSVTWQDMLKGSRIGCSTVMLDTRVFPRIRFPTGPGGRQDHSLWSSLLDAERRMDLIERGGREDYALWLSFLRHGGLAYGLDEPLVRYRVHGASKTARKLRAVAAQWVVYRDVEKFPPLLAGWYLAHYAVRGVMKALR